MPFMNDAALLQQIPLLKQPLSDDFIQAVWSLSNLTQGQFAAVIGVNNVTVSHSEIGLIQSSAFALHQVQAFVERLSPANSQLIRARWNELLALYFSPMQG